MDNPSVTVIALPTFTRNIRTLIKKYRNILNDIQPIIAQLENGEIPGDQVAGVGYSVFKLRIKNSDNQKGKSGGYRLIYYLKTNDKILLLTLYNKSEQDDVVAVDLKDIIEEYEGSNPEARSQWRNPRSHLHRSPLRSKYLEGWHWKMTTQQAQSQKSAKSKSKGAKWWEVRASHPCKKSLNFVIRGISSEFNQKVIQLADTTIRTVR